MRISQTKILIWLVSLLIISGTGLQAQTSQDQFWSFADAPSFTGEKDITPVSYKTAQLQLSALSATLSEAPEVRTGRIDHGATITLPFPDGTLHEFIAVSAPVMSPALAEKFPNIRTYRIAGVENPGTYGRISITPAGFHAVILERGKSIYIDPFTAENPEEVMVYYRSDFVTTFQRTIGSEQHEPVVWDPQKEVESEQALYRTDLQFHGTELRDYRMAMATTAQYTTFHSNPSRCDTPDEPVDCAMAAVVAAMNRVNSIYELEIAVTMTLIDNNDILISQDPSDYTNNNVFNMLGQNQARIDNLIGNANYDIGHVFGTGPGGVANLGSVCATNFKARGVTGLPQPINDPFWVDYVSHEIGHQFRALHTFNGSTGGCSGNRSGQSAYEPGSGSTIMAYSGLCPGQNIQNNADDYFHNASLVQMIDFVTSGGGATCGETTPTGNNPPEVDGGVEGLSLPISTPFVLTGSGTDPDGDELVFNWEQFDLGPQGPPLQPTGGAPLFRSVPPTEEPERMFPRLQNVLSGQPSIGQLLPDYTRNLRFRLTARDNAPGGGGIAFEQVQFAVTSGAGPFLVPVPGNGTEWESGSEVLIAWDVANTDQDPVGVESVSILLSTDGGQNFDTVLEEDTPNSGSAFVTLPSDISTDEARVKVKANDHIFFNVNLNDITIGTNVGTPVAVTDPGPIEFEASTAEPTEGSVSVSNEGNATYNYQVFLSTDDLPAGVEEAPMDQFTISQSSGSVPAGASRNVDFEFDADGLSEGMYGIQLTFTSDPGLEDVSTVVVFEVREAALRTRLLTGQEGWRITAVPVEEDNLSSVLSNFTTQGFSGADNEDENLNPSVYNYTLTGLAPISDIEDEIVAGEGMLTYLFGSDLPSFIQAFGFLNRSPVEVQMNNQLVLPGSGASGPPQQGWNLLGNPYLQSIDLANLRDEDTNNVSRSFQVWNPSANGGAGGYQAWNGHDFYPSGVPNSQKFTGQIQPFQGFWARATGNNPSMVLDQEVLTGDGDGDQEELFAAYYTLELTAGDFTTYSVVMFSEEGEAGSDPWDADQLASLSHEYAKFYSIANRARAINSLPLNDTDEIVDVPMHVDATFSGEFTVRLARISGPAENFNSLEFTDQVTGETVSLNLGDSYTFTYEAEDTDDPEDPVKNIVNLPGHPISSSLEPRFVASFDLRTPVNIDNEELNIPKTVQLNQNYPNPFNPTTNITFGLPEAMDVRIDVYNIAGQRVATVTDGRMSSGYHTVSFDGTRLASGVYLYRLQAGGQVRTEKMTLIK